MDDFLGFGILGVKAREVPSKAEQLVTVWQLLTQWDQTSGDKSARASVWASGVCLCPAWSLILEVDGGAFVPCRLASCRELPHSSQQGNLCGQNALSIGRKLNHQLQ